MLKRILVMFLFIAFNGYAIEMENENKPCLSPKKTVESQPEYNNNDILEINEFVITIAQELAYFDKKYKNNTDQTILNYKTDLTEFLINLTNFLLETDNLFYSKLSIETSWAKGRENLLRLVESANINSLAKELYKTKKFYLTNLHFAAMIGDEITTRLHIKYGSNENINKQDEHGKSPIDYAVLYRNPVIEKLLCDAQTSIILATHQDIKHDKQEVILPKSEIKNVVPEENISKQDNSKTLTKNTINNSNSTTEKQLSVADTKENLQKSSNKSEKKENDFYIKTTWDDVIHDLGGTLALGVCGVILMKFFTSKF